MVNFKPTKVKSIVSGILLILFFIAIFYLSLGEYDLSNCDSITSRPTRAGEGRINSFCQDKVQFVFWIFIISLIISLLVYVVYSLFQRK